MLLGTLGASMLGNVLAVGKEIMKSFTVGLKMCALNAGIKNLIIKKWKKHDNIVLLAKASQIG